MKHYIGTLYFLGQYRPLSVGGESIEEVFEQLERRAQEGPEEAKIMLHRLRLHYDPKYSRQSFEHGLWGASWVEADRPAFPEETWQSMPPCPGLIYN